MEDHPGGAEIMLQYGGQDATTVLQDPNEHLHSDSAYEMLQDYYIGTLDKTIHHSTETIKEPKTFIDIKRPMLSQLWNANYSKEFYLRQVHIPRHTKESAPLLGVPTLDFFTRTAWWGIPLFWAPIITYCAKKCLEQQTKSKLGYLSQSEWHYGR